MKEKEPMLRLEHLTKSFGNVIANNDISLKVYQGEILALLGENGSGKTTLMNMISGIYFPDSGKIYYNGKQVFISSPRDSLDLGIGMIHQHFKLVDVLSAAENIVLGMKEDGPLDIKKASVKIKEICDRYGFSLDPKKKIYDMSVSEKQTVEIIKVLYRGAQLLILDEPTAVLTPQESEKLFAVLRNMKKDGKSVIIITHKLQEVMDISDRVSILRAGRHVNDVKTAQADIQQLTDYMVGRKVVLNIEREKPVDPKVRLKVEGLNVRNSDGVLKLSDVTFEARSGEILGIAGVAGNGQKELLETVAGLCAAEGGSVSYINDEGEGEELLGKDPTEITKLGVALAFVPEDRLGMGLVGSMNLTENMMLRSYRSGSGFFVDKKNPKKLAEKVVDNLGVITPGLSTSVKDLSGGNVQKILVGREISNAPKVLMAAYAVRGLDINSSYLIYDLINKQKKKGVAVIYVGEDLDVLLALCDRILVLCDGKVSGIVDGRKTNKQTVGRLMMGAKGDSDEG